MKPTAVFFCALSLLTLTACASDINADSYQASAVGQTAPVDDGVIVDVRAVNIQGSDSPFGALAGALLGDFTQKELTAQKALQYFVRLPDGKTVSVIQGSKNPLKKGQKVLVVYGRTTKLIPVDAGF